MKNYKQLMEHVRTRKKHGGRERGEGGREEGREQGRKGERYSFLPSDEPYDRSAVNIYKQAALYGLSRLCTYVLRQCSVCLFVCVNNGEQTEGGYEFEMKWRASEALEGVV